MKRLCIGLLLASFGPALHAADLSAIETAARPHASKRVWIRRATMVAGCGASLVFDTLSTRRAVSAGAVEANGLFSDTQGRPQWGKMIGMKAGLCGFTAVMQETHSFHTWQGPNADWTWTGVNAATAAAYTWTGVHNLRLATDLTAQK